MIRARAKPKLQRGGKALSGRRLRVARTGLHEEAASRLRTLIVRGSLAPGEQLNEVGLSEALGVSRTPLREALKLLAAEGLVELRLNRSAIVAPLRHEEVEELFEAVSGIERVSAELAALRMSARDIQKLKSLQERMERHHDRGELREYFELNQQIHSFIVACARNAPLKATHEALLARVERARFFALSSQGRWEESVREHRDVLRALEERDADRAGRLLAHHVHRTGDVVSGVLHANAKEDESESADRALAEA
jgi:DNA-binding GntR family transcriptional regulator